MSETVNILPKESMTSCSAPAGTMELFVDPVYGQTFYFTRKRVFVLRMTDDAVGHVPCWVQVCHRTDI